MIKLLTKNLDALDDCFIISPFNATTKNFWELGVSVSKLNIKVWLLIVMEFSGNWEFRSNIKVWLLMVMEFFYEIFLLFFLSKISKNSLVNFTNAMNRIGIAEMFDTWDCFYLGETIEVSYL